MTKQHIYPIGTPGQPWSEMEKQIWQQRQIRVRSYQHDIIAALHSLTQRYEIVQYGELHYGDDNYPLMAAKSRNWDPSLPVALVTGGVHGYETSGVLGALTFLSEYDNDYAGKLNLLVVPCVSPWAYERTARWNYDAVDPNRQFFPEGIAPESMALIRFISDLNAQFLVHVDLHETTDSDESEFGPALAAKNGLPYRPESIPDGFYLVSDSQNARRDFQHAIIAAVAEVTHIAPSGVTETILGFPVVSPGVVEYNNGEYHLCATMTGAPFTTTTEVYPDSSKTSPQECVVAQVVAIRQAITFALNHG